MAKIKLVIKRKPPPPALEPFTCAICEEEIERDPFQPQWIRPPICTHCMWRKQHCVPSRHIPHSMWFDWRRALAVLGALDEEIDNARRSN
jgi:hypothetical protein